ncbi:MAG TPA: hypothetical protein VHE36_05805 [Sphingomicrobium sp.]|jgi:hypothetical protein|nr:hypothetical protein [Sphingomicrobium sp.]
MHAQTVTRIEKGVDQAASTLFAAACGYALYSLFANRFAQPLFAVETAALVALAFLASNLALGGVKPRPRRLPVPIFDVREVEPVEESELLLTEVFEPKMEAPSQDALVLDDILAKLGSDSRVVRLFDPAAMPTAGELKSRIDRHLDDEASVAQSSDATRALHDALAELRRAIR